MGWRCDLGGEMVTAQQRPLACGLGHMTSIEEWAARPRFRTVQRTALKDLSPIPAGLFVLGQTDTYRGALSIVNQREAFRPPLEEAPDPRSRFAAIALIGVV